MTSSIHDHSSSGTLHWPNLLEFLGPATVNAAIEAVRMVHRRAIEAAEQHSGGGRNTVSAQHALDAGALLVALQNIKANGDEPWEAWVQRIFSLSSRQIDCYIEAYMAFKTDFHALPAFRATGCVAEE